MNRFFTGNKDTDREILFRVKDKNAILGICSSSRYGKDLCNSDFFRNYLMRNYPNIYDVYIIKINNDWKSSFFVNLKYIDKLKKFRNNLFSKL